MGRKPLIILVAAAVVLLLVYVALRDRELPSQGGPQTVELMDALLNTEAVASVRIHVRDEEVVLERADGGWTVANLAGAPAFDEWVEQLLEALQGARGEVRGRSEELFDDFVIRDDTGVHVELAEHDGTQMLHIVVGKPTRDWRGSFVRREGEETVYLVRENLRSLLRLRGSSDAPKVEASAWPDMELVRFQLDELGLVQVEGPDSSLKLVYEEPLALDPAAPPDPPRWALREPEGAPFDEQKVEALARSIANLRAQKVSEMQDAAAAGLEEPERTLRAESKTGEAVLVLVGGEVEGDQGARYARIEGREAIYVLPAYTLDNLFKAPADLAPAEEAPEEG